MDYDSESEQLRQVILCKKERFRVEIRKSKNKEEFAMKRIKLMQEKKLNVTGDQFMLGQNVKENNLVNGNALHTLKGQGNQKESFFDQLNENIHKQNCNVLQTQELNSMQIQNFKQDYSKIAEHNIADALQEFKNQYRNGNRKILFEILCSIRKKLTIATSELEQQQEIINLNYKQNKQNAKNLNFQETMPFYENFKHPVFQTILDDKQFLIILLEILQIIDYSQLKDIQNESLWILINLCAGKNRECWHILNLGILDTFKHLMENCEDLDILENVCWCLGNLAADDAECREKLFEDSQLILTVIQGFYEKFILKMYGRYYENTNFTSLQQLNKIDNSINQSKNNLMQNQNQSRYSIVSELTFFLTNLIKKHPMPRIDPLRKILQILKELFFVDIPQVRIQIIKSFWVLLTKSEAYLNEVLKLDMIHHIMPFLLGSNIQLIKESLDFFKVIVQNCDEFTRKIFVETKFQGYLEKVMSNQNREVKIKGLGLLQKIIDCSEGLNIQAEIIHQERLIYKLLNLLVMEEFQIKISILSILKELLQSDMGIKKLIQLEYMQILIRLGRCGNPYIEKLVIQSLDLIFDYGIQVHDNSIENSASENNIMQIFFSLEGESLLEQLQMSKSEDVYKQCVQLIQKHFE
ncbi:hypothetical protein ABPG74_021430 [Tetrahymena malaccensis]